MARKPRINLPGIPNRAAVVNTLLHMSGLDPCTGVPLPDSNFRAPPDARPSWGVS